MLSILSNSLVPNQSQFISNDGSASGSKYCLSNMPFEDRMRTQEHLTMFLFYGIKLRFSISIKMQFKFCKTNCSLFKCHLFLDLPVRALSLCSGLSFDMLNTLVKTTAPSIINTVKCKMKWPNVQKNYEELFYIFICLRYFTRKITRFFGVDSTNEDLAKTTWVERRRRLAIKKLGGVKVTLKLLLN